MHIALGIGIGCLIIFIYTSPSEIFEYGLQTKIVNPHLEKYFHKRYFDLKATTSISLEEVYERVIKMIGNT